MPAYFEEIVVGHVESLGAAAVDRPTLEAFVRAFAPGWDPDRGLPDALIYAVWAKLDAGMAAEWPQTKRVAVDALRWGRNPPSGELLRGRMTILGKDPLGNRMTEARRAAGDDRCTSREATREHAGPVLRVHLARPSRPAPAGALHSHFMG